MKKRPLILVRGGGDLATGVVHRLWSAGLRVLVLESEHPAAIRRQVSLCEAVYAGQTQVEGLRAVRIHSLAEAAQVWQQGAVPVLVDPEGQWIPKAKPDVLVDAILAKRNLGTHRGMAPLTIALGPGFTAGQDVDVVIETKRGHRLGRIIRQGAAAPNTGCPVSLAAMVPSGCCTLRPKDAGIPCMKSVIWCSLGKRWQRSAPPRDRLCRSVPRSGGSCGDCCGMATRSRPALRWQMWTPAAQSGKIVS